MVGTTFRTGNDGLCQKLLQSRLPRLLPKSPLGLRKQAGASSTNRESPKRRKHPLLYQLLHRLRLRSPRKRARRRGLNGSPTLMWHRQSIPSDLSSLPFRVFSDRRNDLYYHVFRRNLACLSREHPDGKISISSTSCLPAGRGIDPDLSSFSVSLMYTNVLTTASSMQLNLLSL